MQLALVVELVLCLILSYWTLQMRSHFPWRAVVQTGQPSVPSWRSYFPMIPTEPPVAPLSSFLRQKLLESATTLGTL
uniref:Putative secreted peptide n=1 Tax=Anopheles braziliensis TaxID=58242 RepID=A0A2M3ZU10_9DIPT